MNDAHDGEFAAIVGEALDRAGRSSSSCDLERARQQDAESDLSRSTSVARVAAPHEWNSLREIAKRLRHPVSTLHAQGLVEPAALHATFLRTEVHTQPLDEQSHHCSARAIYRSLFSRRRGVELRPRPTPTASSVREPLRDVREPLRGVREPLRDVREPFNAVRAGLRPMLASGRDSLHRAGSKAEWLGPEPSRFRPGVEATNGDRPRPAG